MSRYNPIVFAGIFLLFLAAYGGLPLLKGGLYLDAHEGDSYHFLDILIRMQAGNVPHLDFMTPLGLLAFLPIVKIMETGRQIGEAVILSQAAVALVLLPAMVYASVTRFTPKAGFAFGLFVLALTVTLSYGAVNPGVAISMHYNRWSWAVALVALAIALLPARGTDRPTLDGALMGLCFAWLLLLKVTFFITLMPIVAVYLCLTRSWRSLTWAVIAGLVVMACVTVAYGFSFWLAYLADLQTVSRTEIRPNVGVPVVQIISGPAHIGATLAGVLAVLAVRRVGYDLLALAMLLLVPAFIYITYQNFGNTPFWLVFFALIVISLRPAEGAGAVGRFDLRQTMNVTATACIVLLFPTLYATAMSPVEHAAYAEDRFVPMLPQENGHQDVFIRIDRAYTMTAEVFLDEEIEALSRYSDTVERAPVLEFEGVTFPSCAWKAGSRGYFEAFSEALVKTIPEGSRLFTADILVAFWYFGPFAAPENGAPWYYGDLSGLANSDYLVIPKCSFVRRVRNEMMKEIEASDFTFELVEENALYALFTVTPPAQ